MHTHIRVCMCVCACAYACVCVCVCVCICTTVILLEKNSRGLKSTCDPGTVTWREEKTKEVKTKKFEFTCKQTLKLVVTCFVHAIIFKEESRGTIIFYTFCFKL